MNWERVSPKGALARQPATNGIGGEKRVIVSLLINSFHGCNVSNHVCMYVVCMRNDGLSGSNGKKREWSRENAK
jgi:hypothetical protein